jgi:hypothetical protein
MNPQQSYPLTEIESELLAAWQYDAATETFTAVFKKNGDIWAYDGVPAGVVAEFINAKSKGRYFLQEIKPEFKGRLVAKGKKATQ